MDFLSNEDRRVPPTVRPYKEHKKNADRAMFRSSFHGSMQRRGSQSGQYQVQTKKLISMGFSHGDVVKAVAIARDDIDLAVTILNSFKREEISLEDELIQMGYLP